MKLYGNVILVTLICVVIFWIFVALRPAQATPKYKWQCGQYIVTLHASSAGSEEPYASIVFEPRFPGGDIHFKWDRNNIPAKRVDEPDDWAIFTGGKAFLDGKRCKDYVPKDKN
jgi:hypothetical protein